MTGYSPAEERVLTQLQRGIDPVPRPFQHLDLPEEEVLALLRRATEEGLLRRFGGVFDARRLGYKSTLGALNVLPEQMDAKAAILVAHPGVTHCYERRPLYGGGNWPTLWFTLAMLHDEFEEGFAALRTQLEPCPVLDLPALHRFKIDVIFDLQTRNRDETFPGVDRVAGLPGQEPFRRFSPEEKALVNALDQQMPLDARPFAALAAGIGRSEASVLATLQAWKGQGVLRRIGAILYHREAGFKANAMCVWPVAGDVVATGRRVAARPEVSHCYQRPRLETFPFDLYAMIHAGSWDAAQDLFEGISLSCGLPGGELFASGREFKKSSMRYFHQSTIPRPVDAGTSR